MIGSEQVQRIREKAQKFNSLCACRDGRILILTSGDDTSLVNALRTRSAIVLQKSLREGFGLTVAEGMWKSRAVIGGNVGGIRLQIQDGVNGFLVSSNEEAAERIVQLLGDKKLREEIGRRAGETVRKNFLLTRSRRNISSLRHVRQMRFSEIEVTAGRAIPATLERMVDPYARMFLEHGEKRGIIVSAVLPGFAR